MDLCRGCLSEEITNLQSLFKTNKTRTIYETLTLLNIYENDGLPNWLCTDCINILCSFDEFKKQCINSVKILKEKTKVIIKEEILDVNNHDFIEENIFKEEESYSDDGNDQRTCNQNEVIDKCQYSEEKSSETPIAIKGQNKCIGKYEDNHKLKQLLHLKKPKPIEYDNEDDFEMKEEICGTPSTLGHTSGNISLPEKSQKQYEIAYKRMEKWCEDKNNKFFTEKVMLAYFSEKSKEIKPSSLWSEYCMVRASLLVKNNLDIKKYKKLIAFMKRNSTGFKSKTLKVFKKEQVYKFLKEAPDQQHLMNKVVAIFGIAGALRRDELQKLTIDDVEDRETFLRVKVPQSMGGEEKSFIVQGEIEKELNLLEFFRKYMSLRQVTTPHHRLFVNYRAGKCTIQPVGVNTFAKVPNKIARYLCLDNSEQYTGHCFKRSSAALLPDILGMK